MTELITTLASRLVNTISHINIRNPWPRARARFKAEISKLPLRFAHAKGVGSSTRSPKSCIVSPPSVQTERQKELYQSYLSKLSQPKLDVTATLIELTGLADRQTYKKANTHNLAKVQANLTEDQLRQLAKNYKAFAAAGQSIQAVVDRIRVEGTTNSSEKRFLTFLKTILTNIDATGDTLRELGAKIGFEVDLTIDHHHDAAKQAAIQRALEAAWQEVKNGSGERAADLIRNALSRPPQPVSISRQDRTKTWDALADIWGTFEKRGTFDTAAVTGLLESALKRHGVRGGNARRELANLLVSTIASLTSSHEQHELLLQLFRAMFDQFKRNPTTSLSDAMNSILARAPKQPTVTENSEDEELFEYVPDEITSPVRQLWAIDDAEELRYAIHDLAKELRLQYPELLGYPDKWMHRVKQYLQHRGFTPDRAEAIVSLIDSQAFKERLEGHSGLLVSALRKLVTEKDLASKRMMKSQNIRNDADVYEKILKPALKWFIEEIGNDRDFDPYDDVRELLENLESPFPANLQSCSFFQRHRWLEECLNIPEYVRSPDTREKMQMIGELFEELAQPLEKISGSLAALSKEMIGFDPDVSLLNGDEQVQRLAAILDEESTLGPFEALDRYFQRYGRDTESLVEQLAQIPGQTGPARPRPDSGWQEQDVTMEDLLENLATPRRI
jgi:hypothetical protein